MAQRTISELPELAETPADADEFELVDKSDTSESAAGTSKKVTRTNLVPDASATQKGGVELATTAETTTGTDATRAVTPDSLHDMTSLSGAAWLLDEDDLNSDSNIKVPTQQSIKAYIDSGTVTMTNKTLTSPTINTPTFQEVDDWIDADESWSYASATTITVPSDATTKYQKGDKIEMTNSGTKYFYVVDVASTTLTVTGGSDYSVANAAISANHYSKADNPQGFPGWFNYTPAFTGFSSDPSGFNSVFKLSGRLCTVIFQGGTAGTSNSTSFTISTPITRVSPPLAYTFALVMDNGSFGDGVVNVENADDRFSIRKTGLASFTASGNKNAYFEITYAI